MEYRDPQAGASGRLTVALCILVAIFEGFDLQAAGVAAPKLAAAMALRPAELGWFFSASTFGLMLGAAAGGRFSDRFGRKITLLVSVSVFALLSIATGLVDDIHGLVIARFLTGVGLGGALPNLIAIVAENTALERRSGAVGLLYAGMPSGGAIASLISLIGTAPADWRIIFFIGGAAPLFGLVLLILLLPSTVPPSSVPLRAATPRTGFAQAMFGGRRRVTTLLLWLVSFLSLLMMYLLLNWLPSLLIGRGLSRPDASLVQVAFNVAGAAGSILTGWLMDRRRWRVVVTLGVFTATAAALCMVAGVPSSFMAWFLIGAALGATISGCQATHYGLAPSCYPTAMRGTGVGVAVSIGRFGSTVGPLMGAQLLSAGFSPTQVLLALLPVVAVAGTATTILSLKPVAEG
jgi:AAHS family 3-hydroxyphenylpropionic acid transporter